MAAKLEPSLAMNIDDVKLLLQSMASEGEKLANNDPGAHEKLVVHARALVTAVEGPLESMFWMMLAEVSLFLFEDLAMTMILL